ncbi:MAG: polyphosphate:AMP phosphotransferase [Rhodobacterales bacterium]|nr:polyphosphate:AMP phosphotransferase [Rhodobacterales bacterium]
MFEAAELGRKVSKKEFDAAAPALRMDMVDVQQRLRQADFPVILVFAGVDGAGKGRSVNLLNEWMDPRWIRSLAYDAASQEEQERPRYWRYWRDLPAKGEIGAFLSAWYSNPILDHVHDRIDRADLDTRLERIATFEKTLADDGALILKFWMHLSKDQQKKRLKRLEKDPHQSWRVTKKDWRNFKRYDRFIAAAERTIMRTSTGRAPWMIVEGADHRYRALTVLTTIRDAINKQLENRRTEAEVRRQITAKPAPKKAKAAKPDPETPTAADTLIHQPTILDRLDMTQSVSRDDYSRLLKVERARLNTLFQKAKAKDISSLLVFEGWDAGGKGGSIRRMMAALDARDYRVLPFAAPTDEEKAQHYLWRFWRCMPRAGRVTVFDRSWYGRLLVERVEGFATESEWGRAYGEINDFEAQLVEHGDVLVKYWLNITKDEQEARFKNRDVTPYKRWKLTDEDWRNREKWDLYEQAVNDMVERTSTLTAPWTLVEANDKRFARLKVIRTFSEALEKRLG